MRIIEQHDSPDGALRLLVIREDDGNISIGFSGCSWHTHGDVLAAESGKPEAVAIRKFVDRILADHVLITVSRLQGEVHDIWPTDDPLKELKFEQVAEALEFRRWSGAKVKIPP